MFQLTEDEEYVTNLLKSSNFPTAGSFKQKKNRSSHNFAEKICKLENQPLLKEIEVMKPYENIFDLNIENL